MSMWLFTGVLSRPASVIDVGAGASVLVDALLDARFSDVTVLDVSELALTLVRQRLADRDQQVSFIVADLLIWTPQRQWDAWHDRAVFHFLTDQHHRTRYVDVATRAVAPGRINRSVDVRALPGPTLMAVAIDAIVTHQPGSRAFRVMTAVAYYAGLRPSEVVMLRVRSTVLPADGWGRVEVTEADISFDEPGEPKTGPRSVPIPPVLVTMLSEWIEQNDLTDPDRLLFRTRNDTRPSGSNWIRAWHRALETVGQKPLRVYDCRHAAATTWLRAGMPLAETARRLGHSVETLVSTYVGALDDEEHIANQRVDTLLG